MTDEATQIVRAPRMSVEPMLAKLAENPEASLEVVEKFMAIRRELRAEAARDAYFEALARFQSMCPEIEKTKAVYASTDKGGGLIYKYAPIEVIVAQIKEPLAECCLSYSCASVQNDAGNPVAVRTTVHHIEGHSEEFEFPIVVEKDAYMQNEMQKIASAHTYAKRYSFCGALGIMTADGDDDARQSGEADGHPKSHSTRGTPGTYNTTITGYDEDDRGNYRIHKITVEEGWAANTLDDDIGAKAAKACADKEKVIITLEQDGKFINVVGIEIPTDTIPASQAGKIEAAFKKLAGLTRGDMERYLGKSLQDVTEAESVDLLNLHEGLKTGIIKKEDKFPWLTTA